MSKNQKNKTKYEKILLMIQKRKITISLKSAKTFAIDLTGARASLQALLL